MFERVKHLLKNLFLDEEKVLSRAFFLSVLFIPLTALLWRMEVLWVRLNWLAFLFFILAVSFYLYRQKKNPRLVVVYVFVFVVYGLIFYLNKGEYGSLLRFFVSMLPLLFIEQIRRNADPHNTSVFMKIYMISLIVPIIFSVLQLSGVIHFYDAGEALWLVKEGRISGGYLKPNNLVVYLFPAFLWGIRWLMHKEYWKGSLLAAFCLIVVITSNLRIAIVIYSMILMFYFFPGSLINVMATFYRFRISLFAGVISLMVLGLWFEWYGPTDGLRYRLPMWQAHAHYFLSADVWTMLTGYSKVSLPDYYHQFQDIRYFDEAHNNSLRIIITFGLFGFLLYTTLMRRQILLLKSLESHPEQQFLNAASMLFFVVYSITNEPSFYVSIVWCITCSVFVGGNSISTPQKSPLQL